MSPLQREVIRRYLQTFVLATLVLSMAIIAFDAGKKLLDEGLSPLETAYLLPYLMPGVVRAAMQGASLLAVCLVFGRMAAKSEFLALSSSGLSPISVIRPVLILSVPLSLGCVWLDDVSRTWGENGFRRGLAEFAVEIAYRHLESEKTFRAAEYELTVAGVEGRTLVRPQLTRSSTDPEHCVEIRAELGRIEVDRDSGQFTVHLQYGRCNMGKVGRLVFTERFKHAIPIAMEPSYATSLERVRAQELRLGELTARFEALDRAAEEAPRLIPLPAIDDEDADVVSAIALLPTPDESDLAASNPAGDGPNDASRIASSATQEHRDYLSTSVALAAPPATPAATSADSTEAEDDVNHRRELEDILRHERQELRWRRSLWHQKWANSFCCLTFTLVGIPAAVLLRRADPLSSFFVCFLPILALYQPLQYFGMAYSVRGQLDPLWLHANNAALALAGLYGLHRILRRY